MRQFDWTEDLTIPQRFLIVAAYICSKSDAKQDSGLFSTTEARSKRSKTKMKNAEMRANGGGGGMDADDGADGGTEGSDFAAGSVQSLSNKHFSSCFTLERMLKLFHDLLTMSGNTSNVLSKSAMRHYNSDCGGGRTDYAGRTAVHNPYSLDAGGAMLSIVGAWFGSAALISMVSAIH